MIGRIDRWTNGNVTLYKTNNVNSLCMVSMVHKKILEYTVHISCHGCEFCRRGGPAPCCCGRWCSSTSWFSISELLDGFAPVVIRFLNQVAWNLGLPLFEFPVDSEEPVALLATPARKRYATLLADTISVLACLNCNSHRKIIRTYSSLLFFPINRNNHAIYPILAKAQV